MKMWIVSDLHTESCPWQPTKIPPHDVMIVAGDVSNDAFETVRELHALRQTGKKVVFVPGNHDIFGSRLNLFTPSLAGPVFILPAGEQVIIDGVRFVGATLWTDFAIADDVYASEAWAARHMPEYAHVLSKDGVRLWPAHTRLAHAQHRAAIEGVLAVPHPGPTVVVTHHAPSRRSIAGPVDIPDAAFASDCEYLMRRYRPALWVHGHVHQKAHYWFGDTQVVCNPRGYVGPEWAEETRFEEDLVVEV
ncbi:phosphatase [Devosia pacifica]|uniref:Phosphatase n=1 Tax=Devosia pacifica TaxID=1335967 RepID=A0A918S150_9HYPH|nr:metallophosphoesterase [Devosia pacifica]GHA19268.1 phosphatase [Devosia pacifica]